MNAAPTSVGGTAGDHVSLLNDPRLTALSDTLVDHPDQFYQSSVGGNDNLYSSILDAATVFFAVTKAQEPNPLAFGPLDELITTGFDSDQIWEEIQLLNDGLLNLVDHSIDSLQTLERQDFASSGHNASDHDSDSSADDKDQVNSVFSDAADDSTDDDPAASSDEVDASRPVHDPYASELDSDLDEDLAHELDDDFDSDGSDGDLDESAANAQYKDFFGDAPPSASVADIEEHAEDLELGHDDREDLSTKVSNLFADDLGDSDVDDLDEHEAEPDTPRDLLADDDPSFGNDDDFEGLDVADEDGFVQFPLGRGVPLGAKAGHAEQKSSFEKQSEEMARQIEQLEFESIQAKKWILQGEVTSVARPVNSLLEEDIEFDTVKKPVPIVSEEFTMSLEDRIKERIVKQEFDDVERKVKLDAPVYRPREEISDEKSKQSLAEVYEQEYIKSITQNRSSAVVEALTEQHKEIEVLERQLFYQLDALSNFFFTPKPVIPEASVKSDVAAITLEEAIPAHVSDAASLAPEEVLSKQTNLKSIDEMSAEEKAAQRKKHKTRARHERKERQTATTTISKGRNGKRNETKQALKTLVKDKNVTILNEKNRDLRARKQIDTSGAKLRL
ncbi:Mpp10 protein-domain-containing protein [Catenaria anguillulae PL171]|uniref:U3 small nucleolar ribonucleoprotein protein MPP10 n=1 Tax=Catenaria anguillulae PL171 TaxID=765915 RepID=A0A1Y2H4X2_9FUNG|nr:Mpp10 protein-domain-containing protein [Catenaria anguillulae PL171]